GLRTQEGRGALMIPSADAAAFLPPTFQILTGLSFAALLVIRFVAGKALRPLWGKLVAFAVIFVALGNFLMSLGTRKLPSATKMTAKATSNFLMSLGTARSTLGGAAEFLTLA